MALNPDYMLAPSLQEYFVDKNTGLPLSGGFVYCYEDSERSTLKDVFFLTGNAGTPSYNPLPNPIPLSGVGTITDGAGNDVLPYWYPFDSNGNIQLYYIVVADSLGNTQFTRQAWPNLASEAPTEGNYTYNYARNWQFYSWSNAVSYAPVGVGSLTPYDYVVDDWLYYQTDPAQIINISQGVYTLGVDSVPTNSPFYLNYNNTNGGTAGTANYFEQVYQSVETFEGQNIAVEVWLQAGSGSGALGPISIDLHQYFGSGGGASPDFFNPIFTIPAITTSWAAYRGSALIASTTGKTVGPNGDDAAVLQINMPLNLVASINIGSVRIEIGNAITGTQIISNNEMQINTNTFSLYPQFSTGDFKTTLKVVADPGWVLCNDGTIGNAGSGGTAYNGLGAYALFELLYTNINHAYIPIQDKNGNISTFTTFLADWNALKRLSLTKQLGRAISGAGQATIAYAFTASDISDNLTVADTSMLQNGTPVTLTTNGSLPAPLTTATTYYVININSTDIQLATTLANALAGTFISLSSNGSGTNILTVSNTVFPLGYPNGVESFMLALNQSVDHQHAPPYGAPNAAYYLATVDQNETLYVNTVTPGGYLPSTNSWDWYGATGNMNGGGQTMPISVIQPTIYQNVMIKL